MSVLAIDTSSRGRCACVRALDDGSLLAAIVRHGEQVDSVLPRSLAELLDASISALVVVVGPGSYTGLRAGMAAALGVAAARHLPLHGAGSLEAVAAGALDAGAVRGIVAAGAGRGGVYVAGFPGTGGDLVTPARRLTLEALDSTGEEVFSADDLPASPLRRVDPAVALARVAPHALRRAALPRQGLHAVYVE